MNLFDDAQKAWDDLFCDSYTVKDGRTLEKVAREATSSTHSKEEGWLKAWRQVEADFEIKRSKVFTLYTDVADREQPQRDDLTKKRKSVADKAHDLQAQLDTLEREEPEPSKTKINIFGSLYIGTVVGGAVLFAKTFNLVLPLPEWVGWIASISTVVAFSVLFTLLCQDIRSPKVRRIMFFGIVGLGLLVALATQVLFSAGREIASTALRRQEEVLENGDILSAAASSTPETIERQKDLEGLGFWLYISISLADVLFAGALAAKLERIWKARKEKDILHAKSIASWQEVADTDNQLEALTLIATRRQEFGKACEHRKQALSEALKVAYDLAWNLKEEEDRRYRRLRKDVWGDEDAKGEGGP